MAQNPAHLGDIVRVTVGELKGQEGTIVSLRLSDNRCEVRIATEDDPTLFVNYQYDGHEITLIECKHEGVITGDEQSNV